MDRLEQFIQQNRPDFDTEQVPAEIWSNLETNLPKGRRIRLIPILSKAAAVLLILGIGVLLGTYMANSNNNERTLSDISPEYAEVENYYTQQVKNNINQLESKGVDAKVLEDVQELEKEFEKLKKELGRTKNDEQIVHAMIENYRTKINILQRVLNRIDAPKTPNPNTTKL